jgi:Spy/CpxP family protein refolding chaperone
VYSDKYYAAKVAEEKAKNRKRPPAPDEFRKMLLSKWQKDFLLTDAQVQELNKIFDETRGLTDDLNRKHRPEYDEINRQHREKILKVFTPEQRIKYEASRPSKNNKPKADTPVPLKQN